MLYIRRLSRFIRRLSRFPSLNEVGALLVPSARSPSARRTSTNKARKGRLAWHMPLADELSSCVTDVIASRPADPLRQLAHLLSQPSERPDWEETASAYAVRHNLEQRLGAALDAAGLTALQEASPDAIDLLCRELLASAQPQATSTLANDKQEPSQSVAGWLARQATASQDVDEVRALLVSLQDLQEHARVRLDDLQRAQETSTLSSRKGFLRSLEEQIGAPTRRPWREELFENHALLRKRGETWNTEDLQIFLRPAESEESVAPLIEMGWSKDDAMTFQCLSWPGPRSAIALCLTASDPSLSACTYALSSVLFRQAKVQAQAGLEMPKLYRHLHGLFSLEEADPSWASIVTPDATGFRGLTSPVLVKARTGEPPDDLCFDSKGFMQYDYDDGQRMKVQESPIVCFESGPASDQGMHAAIATEGSQGQGHHGAFPPNTLYRLVEVKPPGWRTPGGIVVNQKLLVVRATYRQPSASLADGGAGKMCSSVVTLQYGSRAAYVAGLSDVINRPVLSMEREFARDFSWTDWKGVKYSLHAEWRYVNGAAETSDNCTPGRRDVDHHGKLPGQFLDAANAFIRGRRESGPEAEVIRSRLPEEFAFLTLDEVLAVRLYSGPAYQPLNDFLRQIAHLSGAHRRALVCDLGLTFAATVGHIVSAIRKLAAAATREETTRKLYRGVRGELARGFWLRDDMGMVCATDTAFMSTSRNRSTPIHYMSGEANVLWELAPREESDAAYHCGADISMLSQFGAEEEVLFPPCCLLVVKEPAEPPAAVEEGGKRFVTVPVQASFV